MLGELFWYGLIAILVVGVIGTIFWLVFKPLVKTYLEAHEVWIAVGFIIVIIIGFIVGEGFSLSICLGVKPFWLCDILTRFIIIVGFCIIFWAVTRYKKSET